jgi:hypothetical protein
VGGVTIGKSFSVGSSFSVGHDDPEDTSSKGGGGSRRHDRDRSVDTVLVPVPVYVTVAVDDGESDEVTLPASPAPSFTAGGVAGVTRQTRRLEVPRSYFTFTPWYNVNINIVAGRPVPLPPPSAFAEGNISATVAETRRETSGTTETVSVVGYAKDVGGIAFAVTPADAGVYVDGRFVGSTSDYSPQREPLLLPFGVYSIELRAQGYVTERFQAYVTTGEVVPFSGAMSKGAQ